MTDTTLTDAQRATLARAREREIERLRESAKPRQERMVATTGIVGLHGGIVAYPIGRALMLDAPNLDDLCRAQADIIAAQAARIVLLENELRLQTGSVDIWTVE